MFLYTTMKVLVRYRVRTDKVSTVHLRSISSTLTFVFPPNEHYLHS